MLTIIKDKTQSEETKQTSKTDNMTQSLGKLEEGSQKVQTSCYTINK